MEADTYGVFVLIYSSFLLLAGFHNSLILEPMSVLGAANYNQNSKEYLKRTFQLHFILTFIVSIIIFLIAIVVKLNFLGIDTQYSNALFGIGFSFPFILLLWLSRRVFYLRSNPYESFKMSVLYGLSLIIGIYSLNYFVKITPLYVFLLLGSLGLVISSIYYKNLIFGKNRDNVESNLNTLSIAKENWNYGKWVVSITIVHWLSNDLYYFLTAGILGVEEVGALRAIQNLILPIGQILTALGLFFLPWASKRFVEKELREFAKDILKISFIMFTITVLCFAILLLGDEYIIYYLYDNNYIQYSYLLPFFAVISIITAFGNGLQLGFRASKNPSNIFIAYVGSAVISVTLGPLLIKSFGVKGVVFSGILSAFLQLIIILIYWQRLTNFLKIK